MRKEKPMKVKNIILKILVVGLLQLTFTTSALAYSLLLPNVPCIPPLPYTAEADHYGGAACIQMILNACPDLSARHYNDQGDIYNSILLHNAEPTMWFSDPSGVEGTLEDPAFSPCGNWVDYSNTNKNYVLGKMLYWMKTQRYLTPVSITSSEHWVTVIGYQTDVEPSYSGSVTLLDIFFYDPNPGNPSSSWVSGTVWLSDAAYWGVPLNKPGSSWHNKYIAIIEPPEAKPIVKVPRWILRGRILPVERIERYFYSWLEKIRKRKLARGPFEILRKDLKIEKPILVKTAKYSYYLIPFKNSRLVAIFNAYKGQFEELRYFKRPQKYIVDPKTIHKSLRETIRAYKAEIIKISTPNLLYDPELALIGRFSPIWKVPLVVKDVKRKEHKLKISLNSAGQVIKGLEELEKAPKVIKKPKR